MKKKGRELSMESLSREIKTIKKNQIKMLEIKT